jgi:23S rRNA pseudouridine2605 synthase
LLVTTNGELANRLMHPSQEVDREYAVRVLGRIDDAVMECLKQGVELEDGPARFKTLEEAGGEGANRWFRVTVKEGRHRLVRRLWQSQGVMVSRLIRIRYGPVILPPKLKARTFHELDRTELNGLMAAVGMKEDRKPPQQLKPKKRSRPRRKQ